ncbi:MAG: acyl carrier protein [Acidiferrobacterales bacterium]
MDDKAVRADIESRVLSVLKEVLAIENDTVSLDAPIAEELAVTSLDRVALVMALEDEFGGAIPDEQIQRIKRVRDIVDYIECHLQVA